MRKKRAPAAGFRPEELFKQLVRATAQGGEDPRARRAGFVRALRTVGADLKRQAKAAVADFQQHLRQVRQSLPPMRVRVLPAEETAWADAPAAQERIEALVNAGFVAVGHFRLDAIPNYSFAGFVQPQEAMQAQVTRTADATVLELSSEYADGTVCECMDLARRPGPPSAPWVTSHRLPDLAPAGLIREFLGRRPTRGLVPVTAGDFIRRIEEGFHRVQCWRAARGGFTAEELRALHRLGTDPAAQERVDLLRHDQAQRWLCNWLTLEERAGARLPELRDTVVIVYDEMPPDLLANAWWCGTGDFDLRSEEFDGPNPLELFRRTNQRRGGPLQLLCRKPAPFAADFYLPRERRRTPPRPDASPLAQAIAAGLAKGDLRRALFDLRDYRVESDADAAAICDALRALDPKATPDFPRQVQASTRLFLQVPDAGCAAAARLKRDGHPLLMQRLEELRNQSDPAAEAAAMHILLILARSETVEGTDKVLAAARAGFSREAFSWTGLFSVYKPGHPQAERLFAALADPLPPGAIAGALLSVANTVRLAGGTIAHPFNSPAGRKRLLAWIRDTDPERTGSAHTATAAIPFLDERGREELLAAAARHPDEGVRLEAAWAAARLGQSAGLDRLVGFCGHWRSTSAAQQYLRELGREDLIPESTREPSFAALAEMCDWLAHPNELGRAPDELEIVDHRRLAWPPERVEKPFWVIRYRVQPTAGETEDDSDRTVGCGLVGSVTFCLFSTNLASRPPEDVFAVHCFWEMQQKELVSEETVDDDEAGRHAGLVRQWRGELLGGAAVVRVAKVSKGLRYPRRVIGLARATLNGKPGYAILDGDRSVWLRLPRVKKDQRDEQESLLLKVHVGRQLLGL